MNHRSQTVSARQRGYSYAEILIATVLIAVSLVPATEALRMATTGASVYESASARHFGLIAKMEEVLADSFSALDEAALAAGGSTTPTSYSDPPGTADRRLVYIAAYDIDNADGDDEPFLTGTDTGVLWVRVEIEGSALALESLTVL